MYLSEPVLSDNDDFVSKIPASDFRELQDLVGVQRLNTCARLISRGQ